MCKLLAHLTIKSILDLRKYDIIPIYTCGLRARFFGDLILLTSGFLICKMEVRPLLRVIVMMKCQHLALREHGLSW